MPRLSGNHTAIEIVSRQRSFKVDRRRVTALATAVLERIEREGHEVTIAFVSDGAIRRLNLSFRGKDRATDVLSFPAGPLKAVSRRRTRKKSGPAALQDSRYLGDVVISAPTATRQARTAGHSVGREVDELVIHGMLHLCGYDHEIDEGEMNRLELELRSELLARRRRKLDVVSREVDI